MHHSSLLFSALLLLQGCCTRDGTFHTRIREANDATLRQAVAAKNFALVPVRAGYHGSLVTNPSGTVDEKGRPVLVVGTGQEESRPPWVVRDAANVLHVLQLRPKKTTTEHHRSCGCPPGGGAPPPVVQWYVPLDDGAKAGEPIVLDVDEWLAAEITYSEHGAACAVP
ncbi:MAG: hypothetical protein IPJ34_04905 [Myxococcales bacterium]|nr:hypothetical protein [Myxococcales bacterium]